MEFKSINPATLETVWKGEEASSSLIDRAVFEAKEAFKSWCLVPFSKRLGYLESFCALLEKEKALFAETIAKETGKTLWDSEGEVNAMIAKVAISKDAFLERCREISQEIPSGHSVTRHKPHGTLAVFGPFNFPAHLPGGHIIPALLAGNTVVFKPSELTPLVGDLLINTFHRAGIPKEALKLIQGGKEVGKHLASHLNIDGLLFTGSWETGRILTRQFAEHPEKILALELGGNNPLIVSEIDHVKAAVYLTIQSAFLSSGQRCTCARRLIVVENAKNLKYLDQLIQATKKIVVGAYLDNPQPFMGPVISQSAKENLLKAQAEILGQGGVSLVKMESLDKKGHFLSPGIIDVTQIREKKDEELFGPLLQVCLVKSFQEALLEANKTKFGLVAGLFSSEIKEYHAFYHSALAGVINWNTPLTGASSRAPFGGIGHSGNHRPSAYYAADYCSYPTASIESRTMTDPKTSLPGLPF